MKLSKIQQIIKEEVAKAVNESDDQKIKQLKTDIARALNQPVSTGRSTGETKSKTLDQMISALEAEIAKYKSVSEADDVFGRAMDKLGKAAGFKEPAPGGPENVEGLPLEKLPKYQQLPDTREEEDKFKKLYLPSVEDSRASDVIYSKEAAQEWVKDFMDKWGLQPGADKIRFGFDAIKNPTVINGSDRYNEWKGIGTDPSQYGRLD